KYILLILLQFCIYTLYCQSLSLTDTKGSVSVGASGDAVYSVPIPTPFGLNGVGPSISLTYSSGGANTIAGYGWNIAGLSSISRAGNRLDIDGNLSPIQLNTEDKFIFEGQRLILKSGTYGLDGSVYETEYYSNIKITYSSSNNSFTVFYPSGIRAFYGISEDSKTPTDWLLKKWIDPQGNYILYEYDKDETQTYITTWVQYGDRPNQRYPVQNIGPIVNNNSKMIKTIRWGKNENFTNNFENTMVFNYVDKLRPEFTYINNTKIKLTKLLNSIEINCNGNLFRRYQLTHETISGNYQRLIKVQEYNNNNEASNPIEFEYNNTSNDINGTGYSNSQHLINSYRQLTGDFDGDGNIDFIVDNNLYLNNLLNNNWSPTANLLNYNFRAWNTAITLSNENKLNNAQSIVGIKPFATSDAAGSYGINIKTLDIVNNTLIENFNFNLPIRCFDKNVNVASTFSWTYSYYIVTPITYTGDFDGDGLSEILIETKDLLTQSYYPYNSITNSLSPQKFFISK
ncbi:MAG: hypothetical protein ORN58_00900, partial [Sediminibacterium sp.]|nr:hypothetical protein [Sediminibacterium sp.]